MNYSKLIIGIAVLFALGCKKENPDEPINSDVNNQGLDCATCPSLFHSFEDLLSDSTETCDDFTNNDIYPSEFVLDPGIIGYTQEGTQAITLLEGGFVQINEIDLNPGFYGVNQLVFDFDGTYQKAEFIVYGFEGAFDEMGFMVNGSSMIPYTEAFPLTIEGVNVALDFSVPDIADLTAFKVSFTGDIESITHVLFESGITELCITKWLAPEPPVINKDHYVYFDDFFNYDGTVIGSYPNFKTPLGYYGSQGTNMVIKFDAFLAYAPTKIGFVHAYTEGESKLVNVQLPGTPIIATIPDSLNHFLTPYGYTVEHYYKTGVHLWIDETSPPLSGKVLDSIIIRGNNLNEVTLGANLQESEIRSICTYYEQ